MSEQSPRARGDLSAAVAARSPDALLRAVREATAGTYDVSMKWAATRAMHLFSWRAISAAASSSPSAFEPRPALAPSKKSDSSTPAFRRSAAPAPTVVLRCRAGSIAAAAAAPTCPALRQAPSRAGRRPSCLPRSISWPAPNTRCWEASREPAAARQRISPDSATPVDWRRFASSWHRRVGRQQRLCARRHASGHRERLECADDGGGESARRGHPDRSSAATGERAAVTRRVSRGTTRPPASPPSPHPMPPAAAAGRAAAAGGSTELKRCPRCNEEFPATTRFCPNDGSTLVSQKTGTDLVGQVLAGRYEIQRLIGEGGMGRVYLAEQLRMGRRCALKVMHPALSTRRRRRRPIHPRSAQRQPHHASPRGRDLRFRRGGRWIPVHRHGVRGWRAALGASWRASGALPVERAIGDRPSGGRGARRRARARHRPSRPQARQHHRSLAGRNGRDQVKVVDFGIAKAIQRGQQQLTRTGFIVGTPEYMSTEQIAGIACRWAQRHLQPRLHPLRDAHRAAHLRRPRRRRGAHPPSRRAAATPAAVGPVDSEGGGRRRAPALARDPGERYATASELANALSVPHETPSARRWLSNLLRMPSKPSASANTPATPASPVTPQAPAAGATPVAPLTPPGSPSPLDSPPLARRKIRWQLSSPGMPAMKPATPNRPPSGPAAALIALPWRHRSSASLRRPAHGPLHSPQSLGEDAHGSAGAPDNQRTRRCLTDADPVGQPPLAGNRAELSRQLMWAGGAVVGGALVPVVVLRSPKHEAPTTPARPTAAGGSQPSPHRPAHHPGSDPPRDERGRAE